VTLLDRAESRTNRLPFRPLLALVVLGLLLIYWPSSALAAEYEVEVCTQNATTGDGILTATEGDPGPIFFGACGLIVPDGIRQGKLFGTVPSNGASSWTLLSPENTRIKTLQLDQAFAHSSSSFLDWFLFSGNGAELFHIRDDRFEDRPFPAAGPRSYTPNSRSVTGVLVCLEQSETGCPGGEFSVTLRGMVAVLEDVTLPTVFPPGLGGATVRGIVNVPYNATDLGSGIAGAALIVDGAELPTVPDSNDGRCQKPYRFFLPCRLSVSASLPLDTMTLSDGQHQVRVAVVDAAGQRTVSTPAMFTVHNAPTSTNPPVLTGQAKVGGELTATPGSWAGAPTAFAFRWLRCPAAVTTARDISTCVPIPGATTQRYVPTDEDVDRRNLVQVTAANASGSGSSLSEPSDVVADVGAPVLSRVSLSRKRLLTDKAPAAARMLLRFSSTEAGDLTIVIDRIRGRQRPKRIATLAAKIKAGRSAVLLSTTIGNKRLMPGRYRATITVRDNERNLSKPAQISFAVTSG
jgi:hypothetical protein